MKQLGVVVSIKGNNAKVSIRRHSACKDCGACRLGSEKLSLTVEAKNPVGAKVGQQVEIEIGSENFLMASIIAYLIPLIALFAGVFIGNIWGNELVSALTGILFLVLTFLGIHAIDRKIFKDRYFRPFITKICNEGE